MKLKGYDIVNLSDIGNFVDSIQLSDLVIFIVSNQSLISSLCIIKIQYALNFGKPILPFLANNMTLISIDETFTKLKLLIDVYKNIILEDPLKSNDSIIIRDANQNSYFIEDKKSSISLFISSRSEERNTTDIIYKNIIENINTKIELYRQVPLLPSYVFVNKDIIFSAYFPREVKIDKTHFFLIYAHLQELIDEVNQDIGLYKDKLGGEVPNPKQSKKTVYLAIHTPLTVILECEDLEFEPLSMTKKWKGDWTRFEFEFTVPERLVGDTAIVRVSIQVHGVEIASIEKCAIDIVESHSSEKTSPQITNPIALAKLHSQSGYMYEKIFISYSRDDKEIAENYRLAQIACGNDVFMDTYSIRTGEDWQKALAEAIDSADIFQLFWSANSAKSENVKHEWDYALNFRCREDGCRNFIRPIYWRNPLTPPPKELNHLNFRYIPFSEDKPLEFD
ncbi:MAG: toll/interleukin-1 receptor domain-containing protein [bacterium]|nr:toll/interleukin-1 receptor domain-containing protein [bacterium]